MTIVFNYFPSTLGGANTVAPRLIQEFVKVRKDDERGREAMIAALVCRSFSKRSIVFYEVRDAMRIIINICTHNIKI